MLDSAGMATSFFYLIRSKLFLLFALMIKKMQPTSTGNQDTNENIKIIQQPQQYIKTFFL